ncbi:hypothetical protein AB3N60_11505 [Leptospira sp. WS39.C2]
MKSFFYILIIINLNCLSRTATSLKNNSLKKFESNLSKISINVNNPDNFKLYLDFYIQDKDSFYKNESQFLPIYYFSETITDNKISFRVPKGKYVGFLQISSRKQYPLFKTVSGSQIIYFGIDENHKKNIVNFNKCEQSLVESSTMFKSIKRTYCNFFNIENEEIDFKFSLTNKIFFNLGKTIPQSWFSFSYAFLQGPQQYPYALFLLIQVPFGFYSEDQLIDFDNLEEF